MDALRRDMNGAHGTIGGSNGRIRRRKKRDSRRISPSSIIESPSRNNLVNFPHVMCYTTPNGDDPLCVMGGIELSSRLKAGGRAGEST